MVNQSFAPAFAQLTRYIESWRPALVSAVGWVPRDFRRWLVDLLRALRDRVEAPDADPFAQGLYTAALSTRQAVLSDPDSKPVVARFATMALGLRRISVYLID